MPTVKPWFASWFDSPYYHILYQHRNDAEAQKFIDRLITYLNPAEGSELLDLACGSGRHSIYLSSKGYNVTGVDLSKNSIAEAKQSENEHLKFYTHDMRQYFRINYFDYIFNFFTSFGYFNSTRDNYKTLRAVNKGLKEDGIFVMDFMNAAKAIENLVPETTKSMDGIDFNITKSVEAGHIVKSIKFSDKGHDYDYSERVQALQLTDFEELFAKAAFDITAIFGDYELNPFDVKTSDRLIIVAKKAHA